MGIMALAIYGLVHSPPFFIDYWDIDAENPIAGRPIFVSSFCPMIPSNRAFVNKPPLFPKRFSSVCGLLLLHLVHVQPTREQALLTALLYDSITISRDITRSGNLNGLRSCRLGSRVNFCSKREKSLYADRGFYNRG